MMRGKKARRLHVKAQMRSNAPTFKRSNTPTLLCRCDVLAIECFQFIGGGETELVFECI